MHLVHVRRIDSAHMAAMTTLDSHPSEGKPALLTHCMKRQLLRLLAQWIRTADNDHQAVRGNARGRSAAMTC